MYIYFLSINREIEELDMLISRLLNSDLDAHEYIHIEDEMPEGGLTDDEIIDMVLNTNKEGGNVVDEIEITPILEKVSPAEVEKAIDKTMRFLYEQGSE